MTTTFIKKNNTMTRRDLEGCHGGSGPIQWVGVLGKEDPGSKRVNFIHDDVLPPGSSIGIHGHSDDQEYYYILSGCGVMTLDGKEHDVSAGDITAIFPGGSHGLENRSEQDLRIMVISVGGAEEDE